MGLDIALLPHVDPWATSWAEARWRESVLPQNAHEQQRLHPMVGGSAELEDT